MARWFTSDLHLGHANIIRYSQRPFRDLDHMNTVLLDALNTHAGPDDELWLLGDIALGRLEDTLPLLRRLVAGRIVLVAGNHDRVHPINTGTHADRREHWHNAYTSAGIDTIVDTETSLTLMDGTHVRIDHFPYASDEPDHVPGRTDRLKAWRPVDDGSWLLCGHVHTAWRQRERMINVGVDAWAGRPVAETDLVEVISAGPADAPVLPWTA